MKLLVLLSKLAHFKLILINLQFCPVHVHLYTYNAHTSVYTCVDIYMYVSRGFFRINLRQGSLDTSIIPVASTDFPLSHKPGSSWQGHHNWPGSWGEMFVP